MSRPSPRVPLTPKEGWLSDGRQVLRFRPTRWERQVQRLEITSGELLPGEPVPLLKNRREISRDKPSNSGVRNARRAGRLVAPSGELVLFAVEAPTAVIGLPY